MYLGAVRGRRTRNERDQKDYQGGDVRPVREKETRNVPLTGVKKKGRGEKRGTGGEEIKWGGMRMKRGVKSKR